MKILVDTSVLVRFVAPDDPARPAILATIIRLRNEGHTLCFTPQTSRESWSVMTRPVTSNGYGLDSASASFMLDAINQSFLLFDDVPGIYATWLDLVQDHGVMGKQVHDANHVAAMVIHGMTSILTLDARDFNRYTMISVIKPTQ